MIESVSNLDLTIPASASSDFSDGQSGKPLALLRLKMETAFAVLKKSLSATISSQIGPSDDRSPVFNTRKPPYQMICALELDFGLGHEKFHGTGWLAGPRTIITAGHCIFDVAGQMGWVKSVTIDPGRNGDGMDARPFGTSQAQRFSVPREWETNADPAFDIGCIHLDKSWGSSLGWLAFGATEGEFASPQELRSAGYSDYFAKNSIPLESVGNSVDVVQGRLFYTLDTERGASGAPVMLKAEPSRAVAIHAYNEDQQVPEITAESNSGPFLGPDLVTLINRWNEAH